MTSTTPTVTPSRRTVARSQTAAISIMRCEMKMTERSPPRMPPDDLQHPLGEVRGQRRGHLVEHEDVRLDGQRPGEVDDPQRRERHAGAPGAVRSRSLEAELVHPVAERLERRLGQAQVGRGGPGPGSAPAPGTRTRGRHGGPRPGEWTTRSRPRTAIVPPSGPDGAGEDLDERALAGAVGAHERVDLAGPHRRATRAQRDDRAVRLRDVRRLQQEVGRDGCRHRRPLRAGYGGGGCRRCRHPPHHGRCAACSTTRPGPCRRRPARGCRSSSPRSRGRAATAGRDPSTIASDSRSRLALVGHVVGEDRLEQDRVRLGRRRVRLDRLAVEELEGQVHARAADGRGVGHRRALEARVVGRVEELADERAEVGADDRHGRPCPRP